MIDTINVGRIIRAVHHSQRVEISVNAVIERQPGVPRNRITQAYHRIGIEYETVAAGTDSHRAARQTHGRKWTRETRCNGLVDRPVSIKRRYATHIVYRPRAGDRGITLKGRAWANPQEAVCLLIVGRYMGRYYCS